MPERDDKLPAQPVANDTKQRPDEQDTDRGDALRGDIDKLAQPRPLGTFDSPAVSAVTPAEGLYVAPPKIEFVSKVGRLARARVSIAVRNKLPGTGPSVITSASPELFGVDAAPNILPTTGEAASHNQFVVHFGTPQRGRFEGRLSLRMQTPGFPDLAVPLVGYSDPSLAPVTPPTKREVAMPSEVDLGEHVVGSHRDYEVAQLVTTKPDTAIARPLNIIDVEGARSRPGDDGPLVLASDAAQAFKRTADHDVQLSHSVRSPLSITFAPGRTGKHSALLEVPILWPDGVKTKQYIRITARAREVTKAPEGNFGELPLGPTEKIERRELPFNGDREHDFDLLSETNSNTAEGIAKAQTAGVDQAARDTAGYVQQPPEPSMLLPLVEAALSMANAGLARIFSTTIASVLAGEAARTLRDTAALPAMKERAKAELAAIAEPIREGFKNAGKRGVSEIKEGLTLERMQAEELGFFDAQRDVLRNKHDDAKQAMTEQKFALKPLLKTQPELALLVQRTAKLGLETAKANAKSQQYMSSLSQYLVAVASSLPSHGEKAPLANRLTHARNYGAENPHNFVQGILRLEVDARDEDISVGGVKLTGISRNAMPHLLRTPLATLPLPMIVTVRSRVGTGTITRDPGGVIRAKGAFPIHGLSKDEPNGVEYAQELLGRLLGKPLREWGVQAIAHDDAGRHEEREK